MIKFESFEQNSLPVVPKIVANEIERVKKSKGKFSDLTNLRHSSSEFSDWYYDTTREEEELLMRAWLFGCVIDTKKKFYLKNRFTDRFLTIERTLTIDLPIPNEYSKFAQEEIDNMEHLGSYEQIEVEDE